MSEPVRMINQRAYPQGLRPTIKLTVECSTDRVRGPFDSVQDIMGFICDCSYLTAVEVQSEDTSAPEIVQA